MEQAAVDTESKSEPAGPVDARAGRSPDSPQRTGEAGMRVCVYGAGAIGGHLAVRLARGGAEVSVVARGAQLAAIRQDGIKVVTSEGGLDARVRASADPA